MKNLIIFLLLICPLNCMGQDNNGERFFNTDGSHNAYFVDTLHIDSLLIIRSKENGQFFAIKPPLNIKLKGNIWNKSEVYNIYDYNPFDGWYFSSTPVALNTIPNDIENSRCMSLSESESILNSNSYQIYTINTPPKYYRLIMILGDAYNYLTALSIFDTNHKPIRFKDMKAYYKLLIPIYKIDYNKKTNR